MKRRLHLVLALITVVFLGGLVLVRGNSPSLRIGQLWPQIQAAANAHGFDPALLAGLVYTESKGNAQAVSSSGAVGLMQLKEAAAIDAAQKLSMPTPSREELMDATTNLRFGAAYLKLLAERFGGDEEFAVMAFFAGPGGLERELERFGGKAAMLEALSQKPGSAAEYLAQVKDHASRFR